MIRRGGPLLWILGVALACRVAMVPLSMERGATLGERAYDEYAGIAENIVEGKGFAYAWYGDLRLTSIHTPTYPYLLAAVFATVQSPAVRHLVVVGINILFSLALVAVLFWLGRHLYGSVAGIAAGLLAAALPTQVYYGASTQPLALYTLQFVVVMVAAILFREAPGFKRALAVGLCLGIGALSYSFVLIVVPLVIVWCVYGLGKRSISVKLAMAATMVAATIMVCTPWTIRNYKVHGEWIAIRSQSGTNLWWGNNPRTTGGPVDLDGVHLGRIPEDVAQQLRSLSSEVEGDKYLGSLAAQYIREDPARAIRLWVRKQRMFWWFADSRTSAESSGIEKVKPILQLTRAAVLLLVVVGIVRLLRTRRDVGVLILTTAILFSSMLSLYHTGRVRYFVPLEAFLLIPAGIGAAWIAAIVFEWRCSRRDGEAC